METVKITLQTEINKLNMILQDFEGNKLLRHNIPGVKASIRDHKRAIKLIEQQL